MNDLPRLALSVRQPWTWAILHAGKDIENRSWQAVNHGLNQRGRIALHASKGMTKEEYEDAAEFMVGLGITTPPPHELPRGCIVGSVEVVDVVTKSDSKWFFGPRGLVLRDPIACQPIPCVGALGYFEWKAAGDEVMSAPARWMLPETTTPKRRESDQINMKW